VTIDQFNRLAPDEAHRELLRCCGSRRWAAAMVSARPFRGLEHLAQSADTIWKGLPPADWLEAFAAHPRIGERVAGGWAAQEQAGVSDAARARFAELNRAYEARFGYIFIVCAAGRSGGEMLAILEERLTHDAVDELPIAAEEQRAITQLRLGKLLA